MSKPVSDLKSHIGYWMRLVSNQVSYAFARKVEDQGVTIAEWVVLREMYQTEGQTSPSAVAELTGLTRGAVSKLIERLLQKDFVTRKEAKDDRRYQDIALTREAIKLVPVLGSLADANDEEFFSMLSIEERETLKNLLQKIADAHQFHRSPIT